jgi:3-methyladenine DNA glycosylase/8-oxoguanine DNA glycosylase
VAAFQTVGPLTQRSRGLRQPRGMDPYRSYAAPYLWRLANLPEA